ncbi:helix-turn-helix domain-containing protein, partial [Leyella stercorea]
MKDRIKKIMEMQRTTQQDFADQLKIAPATLSSIFTGRTRPTLAIVDAIKSRFPQISTDWLMFGKGDMLVKRDEEAEQSNGENGSENDLLIDYDSALKTEQNNADDSPVNQSIP